MPSTVTDIFNAAGLVPTGVVRWGTTLPETSPGVYAVSLSADPMARDPLSKCEICSEALRQWVVDLPQLTMDGSRPDIPVLSERLSTFWIPDEMVVYIGLADRPLRTRVGEYYRTSLGARSPHSGGYFLKTLSNLAELFVHYAPAAMPITCEYRMLEFFCQNVSNHSLSKLSDPDHPFPFANLEWPRGVRKRHGFKNARAKR